MKWSEYLRDNWAGMAVHGLTQVFLCFFLLFVGNTPGIIAILLLVFCLVQTVYHAVRYRMQKRRLDKLTTLQDALEEKYLIAELLPSPTTTAESQVYQALLKAAGKSMLEQVGEVKKERREYREYIDSWIHAIKTPIAALRLLCENGKPTFAPTMMSELERLDHLTSQVLYYIRSDTLEKDYLIRSTPLSEPIHNAVAENKHLLLSHDVAVELHQCEVKVYTDPKWISFILNQLILNAVKYRGSDPWIIFEVKETDGGVVLGVRDNGIGIPADDVPRIFEKGFTGENGRIYAEATGIGLYLCKRLCDKLGIAISVQSEPDAGTTLTLFFAKNRMLEVRE